jgi:Uma2 family endonuclease
MSAEPIESTHPLLVHSGPWSEEEYLALPEIPGYRVELLDGDLLMSPIGASPHQRITLRLWRMLDDQLPDELEALEAANVRLGNLRFVIPDGVVTSDHSDWLYCPVESIVLLVEVESPHGKARDRIIKPAVYAEAGVPWYLRVQQHPKLELVLGRRKRSGYVEHARAVEGEVLEIPNLGLRIDVDKLLRRR